MKLVAFMILFLCTVGWNIQILFIYANILIEYTVSYCGEDGLSVYGRKLWHNAKSTDAHNHCVLVDDFLKQRLIGLLGHSN